MLVECARNAMINIFKKTDKKKLFSTAFKWGRKEHNLESLTNYLLFPTVILAWIDYFYDITVWDMTQTIVLMITISFFVHILARCCHLREKKFHKAARK